MSQSSCVSAWHRWVIKRDLCSAPEVELHRSRRTQHICSFSVCRFCVCNRNFFFFFSPSSSVSSACVCSYSCVCVYIVPESVNVSQREKRASPPSSVLTSPPSFSLFPLALSISLLRLVLCVLWKWPMWVLLRMSEDLCACARVSTGKCCQRLYVPLPAEPNCCNQVYCF